MFEGILRDTFQQGFQSDRALQQLSDLEVAEQRGVDQTTAQFLTLVALTDRTSVAWFLLTSVVAITIAYFVSRALTRPLNALRSPTRGIATACRRRRSRQWSIAAAPAPAQHR